MFWVWGLMIDDWDGLKRRSCMEKDALKLSARLGLEKRVTKGGRRMVRGLRVLGILHGLTVEEGCGIAGETEFEHEKRPVEHSIEHI